MRFPLMVGLIAALAAPVAQAHGPNETLGRTSGQPSGSQAPTSQAYADLEVNRENLRQRLLAFVTNDYLGNAREGHENFADLFADTVDYYGRPGTSRARVMADKRAFYRRWPVRRYEMLPETLQARPGPNDSVEIAFRFNYQVSNGVRSARGVGTTTLGLVLVGDGRYQIVKETGGVVRRTGGT